MSWDLDAKVETTADTDQTVEIDAVAVDSKAIDDSVQAAAAEQVMTEEFRIKGDELVAKVKTLIHEGNIRRIIVKNESGHPLIEIPLTVGVVGGVLSAALFPVLAAVGSIGAVVAHLTLVIEKRE
jgi:CMP-2-keto-3-deoxyoctulosonic acid synthetase